MATYTTPDAVRSLTKRLPQFTDTSTMTASEVAALIDQHEAEVNVALSKYGYAVPAIEPAWLVTWLKKVVTEGVAAAVLKALYQDASGPNSESAWSVWEKRYQDALKQIRDGNVVPAATDESGGRGIASWTTDYAGTSVDLDPAAQPIFTLDGEW